MKKQLLFFLLLHLFQSGMAQVSNTTGAVKPKIMVIPRVSDGQDMKVYYDNNINIQIAIAKINEALQKRGANLRSFDQSLKQMKENQLLNKSAGNSSDIKTMILESSGADIYVETKLDVVDHPGRSAKSVNIILDAYQTGTGNSLASKPITGPMFQTEDIGRLTTIAIEKAADEFLNILQQKFDEIAVNGQSVYVEFTLAPGSDWNFDKEAGSEGKILSELIDEWFQSHALKGVYNNQGVVANKMIISDMRIPLMKPDNPSQRYTGQNLYTNILKYLRSLKIEIRREIGTNNKIIITIL